MIFDNVHSMLDNFYENIRRRYIQHQGNKDARGAVIQLISFVGFIVVCLQKSLDPYNLIRLLACFLVPPLAFGRETPIQISYFCMELTIYKG